VIGAEQKPKVHSARKYIMAILGLRCARHAGIKIIRRFKGHAVSETCTFVFV